MSDEYRDACVAYIAKMCEPSTDKDKTFEEFRMRISQLGKRQAAEYRGDESCTHTTKMSDTGLVECVRCGAPFTRPLRLECL